MSNFLENFNRISTAQKVLVLLLIMITIGVGFYLLIYVDLEDGITAQQETKTSLLSEETTIKRKVANKEQLTERLADLRTRKQQIEKVLPRKAEIPRLLQKIYGQAKIVGLTIRTFKPLPEQQQKLYVDIPVNINLVGTYDQVADFFYYIGRMERIVNIKDISMKRAGSGAFGEGELVVTCKATTYRSNENDPKKKKGRKKKKKKK